MAFWSNLGKIALKAAPIAAAFIPGVGPLASAAIGGLTSGASSKLSGGSWKNALLQGGIGAGLGFAGGTAAKAAKGLGPSASVAGKVAGNAGKVSGFAKGLNTANQIANIAGAAAPLVGTMRGSGGQSPIGPSPNIVQQGMAQPTTGVMPRGGFNYQQNPINQYNQDNPNLATSIFQGRQEALRDNRRRRAS